MKRAFVMKSDSNVFGWYLTLDTGFDGGSRRPARNPVDAAASATAAAAAGHNHRRGEGGGNAAAAATVPPVEVPDSASIANATSRAD